MSDSSRHNQHTPSALSLLVNQSYIILWYQAYILWVELVHRASTGVEVAYILFQNFINPFLALITAKQRSLILFISELSYSLVICS